MLPSFLTSALDGVEWSKSCPDRFTPGKEWRHSLNRRQDGPQRPSGHFLEKKQVAPIGIGTPDSLVRSQWLYRLHYSTQKGSKLDLMSTVLAVPAWHNIRTKFQSNNVFQNRHVQKIPDQNIKLFLLEEPKGKFVNTSLYLRYVLTL